MKWSPEQRQALKKVSQWQKRFSEQQVFIIDGYAGVGKTTLAKTIAADWPGDVLFAAYTGKAAKVLRDKGCTGACTIHSLIYNPANKSKQKLNELSDILGAKISSVREQIKTETGETNPFKITMLMKDHPQYPVIEKMRAAVKVEEEKVNEPGWTLNPDSPLKEAALLIVDERSMVDTRTGRDLMSFNTPILMLGDPAQLPPVASTTFMVEDPPDVLLTEIHRQALDSPILRIATDLRNKIRPQVGVYGPGVIVHERGADIREIAMSCDQIICGRNKTRDATNARVRTLLGHESSLPLAGERIISLTNNRDFGFMNGQMCVAREDGQDVDEFSFILGASDADSESDSYDVMDCWKGSFGNFQIPLPVWGQNEKMMFDWGYAITCHKSQGSQWDSVMVFDESEISRGNWWRWFYTAATRAAKELHIVNL